MRRLNDLKTLIWLSQVLRVVDRQLLKHSNTMLDAMGPSILLECTDRRPYTKMAILGRIALGTRAGALNATSKPPSRLTNSKATTKPCRTIANERDLKV